MPHYIVTMGVDATGEEEIYNNLNRTPDIDCNIIECDEYDCED